MFDKVKVKGQRFNMRTNTHTHMLTRGCRKLILIHLTYSLLTHMARRLKQKKIRRSRWHSSVLEWKSCRKLGSAAAFLLMWAVVGLFLRCKDVLTSGNGDWDRFCWGSQIRRRMKLKLGLLALSYQRGRYPVRWTPPVNIQALLQCCSVEQRARIVIKLFCCLTSASKLLFLVVYCF